MRAVRAGLLSVLLLPLQPGPRPTHHVDMQMMHLLPPFDTGIGDDAKTTLRVGSAPFLQGKLWRQQHHAPKQARVLRVNLRKRRNVQLRNHQKMHWSPRMDVVKRKNLVVLVHNFRRDFARHNFAKQAVGVSVGLTVRGKIRHAGISIATPLFMFTMPLTMR